MVMDGQGGGIGAAVINGIRESMGEDQEVLALGTNATATARMMKAGANKGGTGDNAIVWTSGRVDLIVGPLGIVMANAMLGEVTPSMAAAVSSSRARKILIPLSQENVWVVGTPGGPLPHLVAQAVETIQEMRDHV
jgi:hypothetical protein